MNKRTTHTHVSKNTGLRGAGLVRAELCENWCADDRSIRRQDAVDDLADAALHLMDDVRDTLRLLGRGLGGVGGGLGLGRRGLGSGLCL